MPAKSKAQQKAAGAAPCRQTRRKKKSELKAPPGHGRVHDREGIEEMAIDQAQGKEGTRLGK